MREFEFLEIPKSTIKPCTDLASNLLAIDWRLVVQIACDGLRQNFQHAEYFTCTPLISQTVFVINIRFS